jgi:hypothetical protein
MLKKITILLFSMTLLFLNAGCAVNRATAKIDNAGVLNTIKSIYVSKLEADGRGINNLIAEKLHSCGYTVATGDEGKQGNVDAIVTYMDKWMWDITMYMIELTIVIRDPKDNYPLATGNSFHTSLTRKSPTEMVDEVVENILKEGNKPCTH